MIMMYDQPAVIVYYWPEKDKLTNSNLTNYTRVKADPVFITTSNIPLLSRSC